MLCKGYACTRENVAGPITGQQGGPGLEHAGPHRLDTSRSMRLVIWREAPVALDS